LSAYTALQLLEVLVASLVLLFGLFNKLPSLVLVAGGFLIGKAVLNILAPEGGSVYRRSMIGYGVAAVIVLGGVILLHFSG
jgi:hypothetical protein